MDELVQDVLVPDPLLLSTALALSSAKALVGPDSKPLPSPPLSAAWAVGLRRPVSVGGGGSGVTVIGAVRVTLPWVAVSVTDVEPATTDVVTGKSTVKFPPGTVTLDGTLATGGLLLERATVTPAEGAVPVS